jgi:tRNA(fMet)-specific endonuclease VapC
MAYLIDSDWVIDQLAEVEEAVALLSQLAEDGIAVSIITYMEVYQGILRSPDQEQAQSQFVAFFDAIPVLPFSLAVAQRCAQLRQTLKAQGKRVNSRALDLVIAATALEHDLILVTRNTHDYTDIPDLKLYTFY